MEPEVTAFLIRIVNTLSVGLLWMVCNTTFGIMYGFGFWEGEMKVGNIFFYIFFAISFVDVIWFMIEMWSKPLNIPR